MEATMIRTIVSVDPDDKEWLDCKARDEHVSTAELIRRAIRKYRLEAETDNPPVAALLDSTRGLWKAGDGLAYQQRLRQEWCER
jgi:hypothetical protein